MLADYQVIYSRRRSMAIVVSNGKVTVRAPLGCNLEHIQRLVKDKQCWISRHLQQQQALPPVVSWQHRGTILFRGKTLPVACSRAAKSDVCVVDGTLMIKVSRRVQSARLNDWQDNLLGRWLLMQATEHFPPVCHSWAETMAVNYSSLKLGQWQSRWGYCDSKGVIGLNWRLIMAPPWVYDYVIVHELAHRQLMNHSPAFWRRVERFLPHHQQAKAWLKHHHQQLVI